MKRRMRPFVLANEKGHGVGKILKISGVFTIKILNYGEDKHKAENYSALTYPYFELGTLAITATKCLKIRF